MSKNDPRSLSERVYLNLKQDILIGPYGLQEKLNIDELAEKFQVSNMPIRQAMTRLEHEGLVEIVPRVGYFTTMITLKSVQDMYEVRTILESASARLAAERIAEKVLNELQSMEASYTPGDLSTYMPWIQYNREFHFRIALATDNTYLADNIARALDHLQRAQLLRLDLPPSPGDVMARHQRILTALRERKPSAAAEMMTADIIAARDAALQRIIDNPKGWQL